MGDSVDKWLAEQFNGLSHGIGRIEARLEAVESRQGKVETLLANLPCTNHGQRLATVEEQSKQQAKVQSGSMLWRHKILIAILAAILSVCSGTSVAAIDHYSTPPAVVSTQNPGAPDATAK